MGWSSGSSVACDLAQFIKKHVKDAKLREKLYGCMVETLLDHDWDTMDEAEGIDPILDKILKSYYPDDDDED